MGHYSLDTLPFPEGQTAAAQQTLASPTGDGSRVSLISSGTNGTSPLYDTGDNSGSGAGNSNSKFHPEYAGQIFDAVAGKAVAQTGGLTATLNISGRKRRLRAVQMQVALTTTLLGQGVKFDTTYGRDGVVVLAASGAGVTAKPLSDRYAVGYAFVLGDWAYVVEEGPCIVPIANGATVTAGKAASMAADGTFADAASDDVTVGTWDTVPSSTAGGATLGILIVKPGIDAAKAGTA